jgi:hypothetical protein
LLIFYDTCKRVDLLSIAYDQDASIMLRDQIQIHFYSNRISFSSFNEFCQTMKMFFERFEWQRLNLVKWQILSLSDIVVTNLTLDLSECLRKIVTELDTIQRDIDSAYHESIHLRENVIRACRDHSALINELINSLYKSSTLISILLISIVNYEAIKKAINQHQFLQNDNDTNDQYDQYFVDRRFRTCQAHRNSIVYLVINRRRSKKWERKKKLWKLINPRRLISLTNSSWYWSSDWVNDTKSWHYLFFLFWLDKILSTLVALVTRQSWLAVLILILFRSTLKIEICLIMLNFISIFILFRMFSIIFLVFCMLFRVQLNDLMRCVINEMNRDCIAKEYELDLSRYLWW